jgi:hypothetical protein
MNNAIYGKKSRYKKPLNSESIALSSEADIARGPTLRTNAGALVDSLCREWEARRFCGSGTLDEMDRYRLLM